MHLRAAYCVVQFNEVQFNGYRHVERRWYFIQHLDSPHLPVHYASVVLLRSDNLGIRIVQLLTPMC